MDIEELDLKQLRELRSKVDRAIATLEDRRRREALEAVKKAAQEHGFALNQLMDDAARSRQPVAPKYANPADPSMTWSGRGRKPRWVEEQLAAGKSLTDLAI